MASKSWCFLAVCLAVLPLATSAPPVQAETSKKIAQKTLEYILKPWEGGLDGMTTRRYIRALVTYSKTLYFLDGATQRGLSYEALKLFQKKINQKIKTPRHLKIIVVFVPVPREQLIPALVQGRGDIAAANLTITPERRKAVDFSMPLLSEVRELVVTSANAPKLQSLEDLSGQTVYVHRSSSYYQSLVRLNQKLQEMGEKPIIIQAANEKLDTEDILEMVNANLTAITVVDDHMALFWKQIFKNIRVHEDLAVNSGGQIGWAFRKNSPKLKKMINEFIRKNRPGTLTANILLKRYLQNNKWARNAMNPKAIERFNQTVGLFRKYSNKYHFDYLMITALSYQESRLNNHLKSPAGAVGIMQLLPTTAAGSPIFIKDIHLMEKNIHAGVKYLRHIYDRYFRNAEMGEVEKVLFTFASYNAGPARIQGLRKRAERMGLNPNSWFDNVEVAAAQAIGRETVQYVSNILKYYLAYRQIVDKQKKRQSLKKRKGLKP